MVDDRIEPDDTIEDVMTKLSEGNPGALTALTDVVESRGPHEFLKFALDLDVYEIYGPDIWRGYKDYCDQDAEEFYQLVSDSDADFLAFIDERD